MISASRRCTRAGIAIPAYGNSWCRSRPKIFSRWPFRKNPSTRNSACRNPIRWRTACVPPPGTVSVVVSWYSFGWSGDHSVTFSRSLTVSAVTMVPAGTDGSVRVARATSRT